MAPPRVNGSFLVSKSEQRERVERLEEEIKALPQTIVEMEHHIHGGIYTRTGKVPAGRVFTGVTHRKDHINIVVGDVTILGDGGPIRLTGTSIFECQAGTKRVAFTHADTLWTTIFRTDLTDLHEIEDEIAEEPSELQTRKVEKWLSLDQSQRPSLEALSADC